MKSLVKWMALVAIFAASGKCFMDSFLPEYEAWREKYPPEPEINEDEFDNDGAEVVAASDLFKPDEAAFLAEKGDK
jgi:hypothetical protein